MLFSITLFGRLIHILTESATFHPPVRNSISSETFRFTFCRFSKWLAKIADELQEQATGTRHSRALQWVRLVFAGL